MRSFHIFILLSLVVLSSCKKIDKLTNFYIEVREDLVVNPYNAVDETLDFWLFTAQITEIGLFDEYNTSVAATDKIALSEFELLLLDPDNQNLEFIESIEVYFVNAIDDPLKVGWLDVLPENADKQVELNFTSDNLKDRLLHSDNVVNVRIKTKSNEKIDITLQLNYSFYISSELNGS